MNILSIGNSFSQDAQRYLHRIAKADGVSLDTFNLYIGGCDLETHYQNMLGDKKAYTLEMNGQSTGFMVSLKEALLNRAWDVVTLQQVSGKAPLYETYCPYLEKLAEYVRLCAPKAKVVIHKTWAYEKDSERLTKELGYKHHSEMFWDVDKAYNKAAKEINADFCIPSGEVFEKLIENGIEKIHRDTFHATFGIGRYALGLLWYAILTGKDVQNNTFCDFDEEIAESDVEIVKKSVMQVYNK